MTCVVKSPFDLNELLLHICTFVDCEDFKALSAASRRIYSATFPILENHRRYWAKFQTLEDGPLSATWYWHKLAVSLLTNSLGAPYIRHINMGAIERRDQNVLSGDYHYVAFLKDWDIASESEKMTRPEPPAQLRRYNRHAKYATTSASTAMLRSNIAVLTDNLAHLDYFSDREKRELASGLRFAQQACIRAILLPLLPNLSTLKIEWSSSSLQQHLGSAVRHAAIAHSMSSQCSSFGKLVKVDLTTDGRSLKSVSTASGEYSLEFLSYFMALPSVRKLSARLVFAKDFLRAESLPPSNAIDVSFYDQDISPLAFRNLLADGSPLESIKLGIKANSQWFDEGQLVNLLLEYSQSSLKCLEILRASIVNLNGPATRMELQSFTNLKYITVNYESFQIQDDIKLAKLLPSSLQMLELHTVTAQQEMPDSILQMLGNIAVFPSWSELRVCGWVSDANKLRLTAACQENGISLTMISHEAINLGLHQGSRTSLV